MLSKLIAVELFDVFLVFTRVAAAIMVLPGFSSSFVNERLRLGVALGVSLLSAPILSDYIPEQPKDIFNLFLLLFSEITVGLFIGLFGIIMAVALDLASDGIGMSIGFRNANAFDPTFAENSSLINIMLNLGAVCIIFITGIHHTMISAVVESYAVFIPGHALMFDDFTEFLLKTLDKSFKVGFQLSAPLIVFSLILYTGLGMVSRLMPQLHIFFVSLPLQIYLGCGLLMMSISATMAYYIKYFEEGMVSFLTP